LGIEFGGEGGGRGVSYKDFVCIARAFLGFSLLVSKHDKYCIAWCGHGLVCTGYGAMIPYGRMVGGELNGNGKGAVWWR